MWGITPIDTIRAKSEKLAALIREYDNLKGIVYPDHYSNDVQAQITLAVKKIIGARLVAIEQEIATYGN